MLVINPVIMEIVIVAGWLLTGILRGLFLGRGESPERSRVFFVCFPFGEP